MPSDIAKAMLEEKSDEVEPKESLRMSQVWVFNQ